MAPRFRGAWFRFRVQRYGGVGSFEGGELLGSGRGIGLEVELGIPRGPSERCTNA